MSSDADAASLPVIRAQCSAERVSVSVCGKHVYKASPRTPEDIFALIVVNLNTFKVAEALVFRIHKVSGAKALIKFIADLGEDDIVVVAGTAGSVPSKRSETVVDVFRSLRSVGGSLHMLDSPYVLVGTKRPYLLNGLVHEDHQAVKAAVTVDMRVIRHNRDNADLSIKAFDSSDADDMIPVCWQYQDTSKPHGVTWQDLRGWCTELTEAYQSGQVQTIIEGHCVDLEKMKTRRGLKIRCLNWKGEILSPLCHSSSYSTVE